MKIYLKPVEETLYSGTVPIKKSANTRKKIHSLHVLMCCSVLQCVAVCCSESTLLSRPCICVRVRVRVCVYVNLPSFKPHLLKCKCVAVHCSKTTFLARFCSCMCVHVCLSLRILSLTDDALFASVNV